MWKLQLKNWKETRIYIYTHTNKTKNKIVIRRGFSFYTWVITIYQIIFYVLKEYKFVCVYQGLWT